jgi:hypothetical protein
MDYDLIEIILPPPSHPQFCIYIFIIYAFYLLIEYFYLLFWQISMVWTFLFRMVSGTEQKDSTSPFLSWLSYKETKRLTVLTPEMDCNQTAMGLPPFTSVVFLISLVILVKCGCIVRISKTSLLPRRGSKRKQYVWTFWKH